MRSRWRLPSILHRKGMRPTFIREFVRVINEKLKKRGTRLTPKKERVASILQRDSRATIAEWLSRVKHSDELSCIVLSDEERTGHLPKLIRELVHRLRVHAVLEHSKH